MSNKAEQRADCACFLTQADVLFVSYPCTAAVSDITPARQRGAAMAPVALIFAVSQVIGPVVGGLFTDIRSLSMSGWTLAFWINIPIGLFTGWLFWAYVPADMGKRDRAVSMDRSGTVVCTVAVICLALAMTSGGSTYAWSSPLIVTLLTVGLAFFVLFVLIELYVAKDPIVPFHTFKVRNVGTAAWMSLFSAVGQMAVTVYVPLWLQTVKGESAAQSGISILPIVLGLPVAAIATGVSMSATGKYWIQPVLGGALMIGMGVWLTQITPATSDALLGLIFFLVGLSFGVAPVMCTPQAQTAVSNEYRAVLASTMSFLQLLGLLLGAAAGQTIVNNNLQSFTSQPTLDELSKSFTDVFYLTVVGGALFFLAALYSEHIPLSEGTAQAAL
jgi:MFS family permease